MGCLVWYLTFVKAVALAHGLETTEVETVDESEREKKRRMGRKKPPINPPKKPHFGTALKFALECFY